MVCDMIDGELALSLMYTHMSKVIWFGRIYYTEEVGVDNQVSHLLHSSKILIRWQVAF